MQMYVRLGIRLLYKASIAHPRPRVAQRCAEALLTGEDAESGSEHRMTCHASRICACAPARTPAVSDSDEHAMTTSRAAPAIPPCAPMPAVGDATTMTSCVVPAASLDTLRLSPSSPPTQLHRYTFETKEALVAKVVWRLGLTYDDHVHRSHLRPSVRLSNVACISTRAAPRLTRQGTTISTNDTQA